MKICTLLFLLQVQTAASAAFYRAAFVSPPSLQRFQTCLRRIAAITNDDDDNDNGEDVANAAKDFAQSRQDKPVNAQSRRDVLRSAIGASVAAGGTVAATKAGATTATTATSSLLADLPMIRLKLPENGVGNDYIATQLCLPGQATNNKPVEFMLDTGLTLELITPHLRDQLGLRSMRRSGMQGLTAAGADNTGGGSEMVDLRGTSLCDAQSSQLLPLPELHAVVTDFPQEHMDPKHDPVEGMLGLEVLSQFDVDLDFKAGRIRLYKPGTAAAEVADKAGLVEIPAVVINDTGILGIRLTAMTARSDKVQPVLGIIDCGSTFSVVNWKAADIFGLPPKDDRLYEKGPKVVAVGVDGRPFQLPTLKQSLSFAGEAQQDAQGRLTGFRAPSSPWKAWDPVLLAVGDLPVFPDLLGDGVRQYTGPAALIGLDILAQRRIILESSPAGQASTRRRRLFVSPT